MAVYSISPYSSYKDTIGINEDHLDIKRDHISCTRSSSLISKASKEDAKVLYQISYLLDKKKQQKNKKNVDQFQSSRINGECVPQNGDSDIMSYGTSSIMHTSYSIEPASINREDYNIHKMEESDDNLPIPLQEPPRNKTEERALKRIRRKIKNKLSAQESRRKKKEYLENLEKTVVSCTSENSILKEQVSSLNNTVRTLLRELQRMQETKPKVNMGTQTGTCLKCYLKKSAKSRNSDT